MILGQKLAQMGLSVTVLIPGNRPLRRVLNNNPTDGLDVLLEVLDMAEDEDSWQPSSRSIATGARRLQVDMCAVASTMSMFQMHGEALRRKFDEIRRSPSPPVYAVMDYMLFSSASDGFLAENASLVPICVFCPISAASIIFHMSASQQTLPSKLADGFVIPGLPPFRPHDISDYYRETSHVLNLLFSEHSNLLAEFHRLMINTFHDLENGPLDVLRLDAKATKSKVYAVGPLLPPEFFKLDLAKPTGDRAVEEIKEHRDRLVKSADEQRCKEWLDGQPETSVLYICFGSWISLSRAQILELAVGLEASEQGFLWVFSRVQEMEALPEGFVERMASSNKGFFYVGWAPQFVILSHSSTGAFVTTCAWNSVLECISLGGLPMLAWPITMDHLPTCRYLVDVLHVAVEVIGDGDERLVGRAEVEAAVRAVTVGEEAAAMRRRAAALRRAACEAATQEPLRPFVTEVLRHAHQPQ
ncbi:UDP-glycosyltransferase 72B1-like [Selaginella moellendorffii]|uniref:UDP-glycosyltransferase 72B1-like n=1 Tax=Selaginella moellendorffii TaxID=88036 RepID=UPI000D1C38DE|nr:UDP-glycosyltransferase 72B1-like [Selaginella moellendorffii]|eukprot:XP_024542867.1 UDP-glycosyltransferase 72B1-like [Selaginella moellendorffii]